MAFEEHKEEMKRFRERAGEKLQTVRTHGLRCLVCGDPIPERRARMRSQVCSDSCKEALRTYRLDLLKTQKCPHCNHPSTPEEWELYALFKAWLRVEGNASTLKRAGKGNPQWEAKAKRFAKALGEIEARLVEGIAIQESGGKMETIPESIPTWLSMIRETGFSKVIE